MFFFKVRPRFALPLLVFAPCVALVSVASIQPVRADAPVVGVRGWTTGSQTFVRVRPSALTPPVAKVPSNTPLFVWGRFNEWYRVETHDHFFGWVHKEYIRSPRLWKVKVISHFKAKQASDQGSNQTLYGTPQELKAYHAQYGGQGAIKGLALKGVYLTPQKAAPVRVASAPKPAPKPKPVLMARTPPLAPRLSVETVQSPRPPAPEESATGRVAAQTLGRAPEAMAPAASSLAGAVGSWRPAQNSAPVVAPAPRLNPSQSNPTRPSVATPSVVTAPPVQQNNSQPLSPVLPGNVLMASAPRVPVAAKPATKSLTPEQLHIAAWQKRKRAKEQRWLWLQSQKTNAWKWRQAQAQKRAVAAQNRRLWLAKQRQQRGTLLASRKATQRNNLAAKNGLAPKKMPANVPGQVVAPISPDELLRAREQFLKKNGVSPVKENTPVPSSPGTPFVPSGLSTPGASGAIPTQTVPVVSGDLKGNLNVLLFGTPEQKTQTARDLSASGAQDNSNGRGAPDSSGATTSSSMPAFAAPAVPAQTRVPVTNIAPLPSGAAPSRGGSPRDRAVAAWRSGVATQALSYRGRPYVFGAASPSRGFDCSGLIYFLLRQRGLNPPRTAAGYRTYGTAVSRGKWQPGDLILFANTYKRGISHIGVYLKDGKFVHAASTGKGVRVDSLSTGYFASKYWGARRVK